MKKRTDAPTAPTAPTAADARAASAATPTPTVRARLRAAARSFARAGRAVDRGSYASGYEHARISAELATIAERRAAFDR